MEQKHLQANQKLWDDWASFHPETELYDMQAFLGGKNSLMSIEREALGDVDGKSLLHLQCHFSQDTLSWARLGARATGVDFSATAIATARELNQRLGLNARFVQSNVLELAGKLDEQFDIVFTSYGAIVWLNDLRPWAETVAHHLRPGGTFCMAEFHPTLMMMDMENGRYAYPYFNEGAPVVEEVTGSYAKRDGENTHTEYTWQHSLSDILTPLLGYGLQVEEFREYAFSPYNCFPNMEKLDKERYRCKAMPGAPHVFMLKMRKNMG